MYYTFKTLNGEKISSHTSLIILLQSSYAQKWDTTYGGYYTEEYFEDVIESYDKGYLICGGNNVLPYPTLLIKTDINGQVLWEKTIQHNQLDVYKGQISQNKLGEIASTMWVNSNDNWPFITKLGPCGNKLWCRVYIEDEYDWGVFEDAILFDNGDVLALCKVWKYMNYDDQIFLYYISSDGNLIWKKSYASEENYPLLMGNTSARKLYKINDGYMIVGECYYPNPGNPTTGYLRPIFIRIDNDFKELWILPFGVSSNLISYGLDGMVQLTDSTYMGLGALNENTLLTFFNDDGEELGYNYIYNENIGPDIGFNVTRSIVKLSDSLFIASTSFGPDQFSTSNGELIIDTSGNVYKVESRPNAVHRSKIIKTFDNKFTIGCTYEHPNNNNEDIYLYKINDSLQHDTVYTANYVYDSLCPFQIQSGTIDISDCLLFTDVGEVPSPEEYYTNLKTVSIKAYPNPVNEGVVTFEFGNMEYLPSSPPLVPPGGGKYPSLVIYNIYGQKVHEERIYQYQGESKVAVGDWGNGMYIGIVVSEGKPVGRCKFVVN